MLLAQGHCLLIWLSQDWIGFPEAGFEQRQKLLHLSSAACEDVLMFIAAICFSTYYVAAKWMLA